MSALLDYQSFHLVGIKGVALTALAQCLLDAGKEVTGSDVTEKFVTQPILDKLRIQIQTDFSLPLPAQTECVIYTAAHGGNLNPQVILAQQQQLVVFSHAQALGEFFNPKQGIAVAGVGGKSTTSAMITWILSQAGLDPSYAVGVGNIPDLGKTGHWSATSEFFVAEADEYAEQPKPLDPTQAESWHLVPRFHYLQPQVTVCTNLAYDHPDVYPNFAATQQAFQAFFQQIKSGGVLIYNQANQTDMASILPANITHVTFGEAPSADFQLLTYQATNGQTNTTFTYQNQSQTLTLQIPGKFNALNGLAALAATTQVGVPLEKSLSALATFHSTKRRFEFVGEKNQVKYYDDYAHHPAEVKQAIEALNEWYPTQRKVIMFQSHTYSRTKQLFNDFVDAFSPATEVLMIDIFPSARENADPSITSDLLCQSIQQKYPAIKAQNLKTIEQLAEYCKTQLHPGDVAITLGAGDIYQVHDLL